MNLQSENKSIPKLLALIVLALIIPLTVFLAKQSQEIRKKASGNQANLSLAPSTINKAIDQTFPVHVWLNTGGSGIVFAQVKLTFDKTKLNVASDIQTTSTMSQVVEKSSPANANSTGIINITLTVPGGGTPASGAIDFATITFKGIATGTANVNFDVGGSQIVQTGTPPQAMTISATGGTYTIGSGGTVGNTATLSFAPATKTTPINQTFASVLKINTGTNGIVFAQVKLTFDKTKLNVASDIQTTSTMSQVVEKSSPANANSTGIINITLTVPGGGTPASGAIDFATITFKGIATGTANVNFDVGGSQIVQTGTPPQAMTISATNASYTIGTVSPTPTTGGVRPTPTPTRRPTVTPTRGVTPTPTRGVTPSAVTPTPPAVCRPAGETCTYSCKIGEECIMPPDFQGICCSGLTCMNGVCQPIPSITGPVLQTLLKLKLKINGLTTEPAKIEDRKQPFKITLAYNYEGSPSRTYDASLQHERNGVFSNTIDISDFFNPSPIYSEGMGGGGAYPTYRLFVKWIKSLQKKYTVALTPGTTNVIELTTRARDYLDACDLPDPNNNRQQDGVCNSVDYTLVASRIGKTDDDSLKIADLNLDGAINGIDVNILVNAIFTRYEDEVE